MSEPHSLATRTECPWVHERESMRYGSRRVVASASSRLFAPKTVAQMSKESGGVVLCITSWLFFLHNWMEHASARRDSDNAIDDYALFRNASCSCDGFDDGAVGNAIDIQHVPCDVFECQAHVDALGVGADKAGQAAAVE